MPSHTRGSRYTKRVIPSGRTYHSLAEVGLCKFTNGFVLRQHVLAEALALGKNLIFYVSDVALVVNFSGTNQVDLAKCVH